jgi:hypothetical protein
MAEDWLKHLVHEIKEKDHAPAEEAGRSAHEYQIIQRDGPALWLSFADSLGDYVEDMKADFNDDITLREGQLTFTCTQGSQISIGKAAFPYVTFTANPNYPQRSAQISYASQNPRQDPGQSVGHTQIPCRFELNQHNKVYLQLDGKPFHEPQDAAKYIIQKLFTIPG